MDRKMSIVSWAMALAITAGIAAQASPIVWGGGDAEYTVGANWIGGNLPDTFNGDIAQIDAGIVTYTAGPDLHVHNGGELLLNGGSWTQVGGVSWIQLADGGTLTVAGGAFDQGTSGNVVKNATTLVQVSAGSASFTTEYGLDGSTLDISGGTVTTSANVVANAGLLSLSDGVLNVGNEMKATGATINITGGELNANLISFEATDAVINFSGGQMNMNAGGTGFFQGIYAAGDGYIDFTSPNATLFVNGLLAANIGNLFDSRVRANGVADINAFAMTEADGGLYINLIPEPASLALLGIGGVALIRRRH